MLEEGKSQTNGYKGFATCAVLHSECEVAPCTTSYSHWVIDLVILTSFVFVLIQIIFWNGEYHEFITIVIVPYRLEHNIVIALPTVSVATTSTSNTITR